MKSNVNLHVPEGATLRFSGDPEKHLPVVHTRREGIGLMNYSLLIYAHEQENIMIRNVVMENITSSASLALRTAPSAASRRWRGSITPAGSSSKT